MIISENLCFTYSQPDDGDFLPVPPALCGVNFSVTKGEFLAIVGRNGSGKSTLARHINALLSPTQGTLWINGLDTKDESHQWEIRKTAGMVFQNPDNQIIATTVEEDIAFGPENLGIPSDEIRERVNNALATVGMVDCAKLAPHHLSGGQKQRVAIAGVLAMLPDIIVFDESTAMLDPAGRREVLKTITDLNREKGITIIFITHFMEETEKAGRLIVMEQGKIYMDDTPRNIFKQSDKLKQLGLNVPQAVELALRLKNHNVFINDDILTVDDFVNNETVMKIVKEYPGEKTLTCPEMDSNNKFFHTKQEQTLHEYTKPEHIKLNNLTHIYNKGTSFEKTAINNINLTLYKGEIVGIIGHTGSGKSTLVQHFNALLKPTAGQILINGEEIHANKKKLKSLRQRVGLVFQYPEHQLFESTVYGDVAFGPVRMGLTADEIKDNVLRALSVVGIGEELYEKSPFLLSGGQKRRVAIAGILAMSPEILILDEPTAGLDPQGRDEILSQIKKMHNELNITVIIISHSMDDVSRLCGRIIVMNEGKIALDGTPTEVFSQGDTLENIGLTTPQINKIMTRLSKLNPLIPTGIFTVEDATKILTTNHVPSLTTNISSPTHPLSNTTGALPTDDTTFSLLTPRPTEVP
jgi:energy-coupling factor transport system ATP-binding protein